MAGYDGQVVINTKLDDSELKKGLSGLSGTIKSGTQKVARVVGASMGAATAAVGAFSISSVNYFVDFENKMNEVFTLIPGASQEMKDSMVADTKELATEMGVLPEEVVPAIYQAISAGIPTENVFDFVREATKNAKAGVAELDDSVGVLSTAVNTYAEDGLNAQQASDMLFTAVKLGVTSIPELATNLGKVIPIAESVGFGFDEVSASVSTLTAKMGKGSTPQAITNLRGMLNELGQDGSKADMAFRDIAGKGLKQFLEEGGNAAGAMEILQQAAEKNNTAINNLFGSVEAGQAALILAGGGFDKFSSDLEANQGSIGATDEAFAQMASGTQFSIDQVKANVAALKLDLAEQFVPAFNGLLESTIGMFEGTEGASEEFAESLVSTLQTVLDKIIPIVTDLTPKLVEGASQIIEGLVGGITQNTDQLADVAVDIILSLVDFITDNLPGLVIASIKIMGAIAEGLVKALPRLGQAAIDMVVEMKNKFIEAIPGFIEVGKNIVLGLVQGIKDLAAKPVEAIKDAGTKMLNGIKGLFGIQSPSKVFAEIGRFLIEGMANGLNEMFPGLMADSEDMVEALEAIWEDGEYKTPASTGSSCSKGTTAIVPQKSFGDIWGGITDGWDDAKNELSQSITNWTGWASSTFVSLGNSLGDAFGAGMQSLAQFIATQKQTIADLGQSIADIQDQLADAQEDLTEAQDDYADAVLSGDKDAIKAAEKRIKQQQKLIDGLEGQEKALKDEKKSIEDGSAAWQNFGKVMLQALADVLYGLGAELAARAAIAAVTFNWAGAAVATAGSVAAFAAGIAVDSWAGSFADGGIVPQVAGLPSTGDRHVANVNPGELILNQAQQSAVAAQLTMFSRLTDLLSSLQFSSGGGIHISMAGATINGLNEDAVGRAIYHNIRSLQAEGVLKSW